MAEHRLSASCDPVVELSWRGIVMHLHVAGTLTGNDFQRLIWPLLKEHIVDPGRPTRLVIDFSQARVGGFKFIEVGARASKAIAPFIEREAWIGIPNGAVRFLAERAVALSGRQDIRFFDDEASALAWSRQD